MFAYMYVCVLLSCMVPINTRRGHQIPWNWNYGWLGATIWVLGIEATLAGRAASVIYDQTISSGLK